MITNHELGVKVERERWAVSPHRPRSLSVLPALTALTTLTALSTGLGRLTSRLGRFAFRFLGCGSLVVGHVAHPFSGIVAV